MLSTIEFIQNSYFNNRLIRWLDWKFDNDPYLIIISPFMLFGVHLVSLFLISHVGSQFLRITLIIILVVFTVLFSFYLQLRSKKDLKKIETSRKRFKEDKRLGIQEHQVQPQNKGIWR